MALHRIFNHFGYATGAIVAVMIVGKALYLKPDPRGVSIIIGVATAPALRQPK